MVIRRGRWARWALAVASTTLLLALPTLALATLALPSCKHDGGQPALRVVFWAGIEEQKAEQANVDAFVAAHPGVKVSLESIPDSYLEKLVTAFAAGKPPDVLLLDSVLIPRFLAGDVLLDLAPYLSQAPALDPQAFFPEVWSIATRPGADGGPERVYALPKDFTPLVVYYNKRVFDEAGAPYPAAGWTWDDFAATARALTYPAPGAAKAPFDQRRYGTVVTTWMGYNIVWFWQAGGDVLSPDGTAASGYLDSPACIDAVRYFTGLVTAGVAPDPTAREGLGGDAFMNGRIGMNLSGHWAMPGFRAAAEKGGGAISLDEVGVAPLPQGRVRANVIYESGWAVAQASKQRALAVELAKYLAGPECQRRRAAIGLALSANREVAAEYACQDPREQVFIDEVPYCRAPWGTRIEDWSVVESLIGEGLERILLGYDTVQKSLKRTAALIDAELNML